MIRCAIDPKDKPYVIMMVVDIPSRVTQNTVTRDGTGRESGLSCMSRVTVWGVACDD